MQPKRPKGINQRRRDGHIREKAAKIRTESAEKLEREIRGRKTQYGHRTALINYYNACLIITAGKATRSRFNQSENRDKLCGREISELISRFIATASE